MINTASSYDHLKEFFDKVSDDPEGKNLTFSALSSMPALYLYSVTSDRV